MKFESSAGRSSSGIQKVIVNTVYTGSHFCVETAKRCEVATGREDGRTDGDSERRAPLVRPFSRGGG